MKVLPPISLAVIIFLTISCKKEDPLDYDSGCNFSESIILTEQREIDSLGSLLSNCDKVSAQQLWIKGEGITSLKSLGNKFSVIKKLWIENSSLTSLDGLGVIDTISILHIHYNELLESLSCGFNDSVIANIELIGNPKLQNIDELDYLRTTLWLSIIDNKGLTSLQGLTNLKRIDYQCLIRANFSLISLSGLESISIKREELDPALISIAYNSNLTDLCAISQLMEDPDFNVYIGENGYNPTLEDFQLGKCQIENK